jgi:hypothetical protein
MRTARACALVLLLGLGARSARAEDPERPLLARIADPEDKGRDEALAAWNALSVLERTRQARAGLRSDDPALAFAAAVAVSPWSCDLEDLNLRSRAMERDPIAWFDPPAHLEDLGSREPLGFGAPDLLAIWKALAARDPDPQRIGYSRTHRVMLPEHVPQLVPLLESAGPTAFRALLRDLCNEAANEDGTARQETYVRAFQYALGRLRAEAAGLPRPRLQEVAPAVSGTGLPKEFIELARAAWTLEPDPFRFRALEDEEVESRFWLTGDPSAFLHRWALRTVPAEADAPFLVAIIEGRANSLTDIWAARRIATLSGRTGGHALHRVLQPGGGAERVFAAAQRAASGDREPWFAILREAERRSLDPAGLAGLEYVRWLADPVQTRETLWESVHRGAVFDSLSFESRWSLVDELGLEEIEQHFAWLGDRLVAEGAPIRTELWFVDEAPSGWLTPERAARFAERWATHTTGFEFVPGIGLREQSLLTVCRAMAKLAAMAPQPTLALLRAWAAKSDEMSTRHLALQLLARLGDPELAPWMVSALPEVQASTGGHRNLGVLGLVRTTEMERLLREKVALSFPLVQAHATCALAVFYGCPQPLAEYLWATSVAAGREKTWEEARALVLAKDPIGAVLHCTRRGPFELDFPDLDAGAFALSEDPRVRERIAGWRERRESGLYWVGTACAAQQGDEEARAQWRGFLRQARTFLLDELALLRLRTLGGDPAWVADWLTRLDANCCLARHAHDAITAAFPTLPVSFVSSDTGGVRKGVERWFERHRGTFVWSPILDGWIPGPRR